jgi:hypothetical protein
VAKDDVVDDGRNRSPDFLLRAVVSGLGRVRCSGARNDERLCPGGARGEGEPPSTKEEARGVEAHRKCRGFVDGSGEMASLCTDGLVAEEFWEEGEMVEEGEGLL